MNTNSGLAAALAPTGPLRAAINLGNPVLAQGTPDDPQGVTVDLARELAGRLEVEVRFNCHQAARNSFEDLVEGRADIAFLATEPARAEQVRFTSPYAVIEAVYAVPSHSPLRWADEVDRPGVRVGVKQGSAYDLFLTRRLHQAKAVPGADGTTVFESDRLEVAAGLRTPLTAYAQANDLRVLEPAFQQIQQALALPLGLSESAVAYVAELLEDLKSNGFIEAALQRSGRDDAQVAPTGG